MVAQAQLSQYLLDLSTFFLEEVLLFKKPNTLLSGMLFGRFFVP